MTCGYNYKIQFPNGKHYIGLTTTSLKHRQGQHRCAAKNGDTQILYKALRKYDMIDTFELIEIDTADTTEELCEKEIQYIISYNSYIDENGYNMTLGGEGTFGYIHTEECKQKMSEAKKEYYEKNPEASQKAIEGVKKYNESPEARQQARDKTKKQFESPEARHKLSEILKKYNENPEARQKNREAQKIYHKNNPEAGQKNSEAQKIYHKNNPEARQKQSDSRKKHYKDNPEARRKIPDGKGQNKPFEIFTIDGAFVNTFCYQFEANEYLQKEYDITTNISIGLALSGKIKSSAGFIFTYK